MKKTLQILEQRKILRQQIIALAEETLAAKILHTTGAFIQKLTWQTRPPSWYVSTILLIVIAFLPQTLFALILRQPEQIIGNGWIWSASVLIAIPIIPLVYLLSKYILTVINDHIIENIEEKHDIDDLSSFLFQIGDQKKSLTQALFAATLWAIIAIPVFSYFNKEFIGIGWSIDVWLWGLCAFGLGLPFLLWFTKFPGRIKSYQFNLYELNPSQSELITHLSALFTRPFLVTAVYLAIGTFIASLFEVFIWVVFIVLVVFWIPLIMQFINSQSAINKIISIKKWQTLNSLEEQIHKHWHNNNHASLENTETVRKLMELHEKVYNSSNIRLTVKSMFDLLSQLMLPILTFILSNLGTIMDLFK